jgi:starvation-inducible outer membrane lipoprotein
MVLLALTGCQSPPPPLDAAQAQCGHAPCYCSYKNQLVTASDTQRYGGLLPPEACYIQGLPVK